MTPGQLLGYPLKMLGYKMALHRTQLSGTVATLSYMPNQNVTDTQVQRLLGSSGACHGKPNWLRKTASNGHGRIL